MNSTLTIIYKTAISIVGCLCTLMVCSCSTKEIPVWDSATMAYAQFTSSDDYIYSFAGLPQNITDAIVEIPITLHLDPAIGDREIWVEVSRQPSDPLTHFEYSSQISIESGATSAILTVKLFRSTNLTQEADEIEFRIVDSPSVKAGVSEYRSCKLIITDFFVKPDWWGDYYDSYYNPVGECNQVKLELWFEVFGNFDDPRHGQRAWTGADAVIALALINKASMGKYGKMFHELLPTDVPL